MGLDERIYRCLYQESKIKENAHWVIDATECFGCIDAECSDVGSFQLGSARIGEVQKILQVQRLNPNLLQLFEPPSTFRDRNFDQEPQYVALGDPMPQRRLWPRFPF